MVYSTIGRSALNLQHRCMLTENGHVINCSNSYTQLVAQCCHHPDCIASFREIASLHCCLSSSILLQLLLGQFATAIHTYWLMGTNIHRVLMLEGVLVFRKLIANTLIGTYIHRVPVIDGYLHSRVDSM